MRVLYNCIFHFIPLFFAAPDQCDFLEATIQSDLNNLKHLERVG